MLGAGVERLGQQRVGKGHQAAQRIVGQLRIGGVALTALNDDGGGEAAAPADLDLVAEGLATRRLTDDRRGELLAGGGGPRQKLGRAVDRRAFFVAGDQEGDAAAEIYAAPLNKPCGGADHCSDAALHVGGAASVKHAIGGFGGKRSMRPVGFVARRHDVDVAGKGEMSGPAAGGGKQVFDVRRAGVVKNRPVDGKARRGKCPLDDIQRPADIRRDAPGTHQRGEKGGGIGCRHAASCFGSPDKLASLRPRRQPLAISPVDCPARRRSGWVRDCPAAGRSPASRQPTGRE